jgi:hypothetical protein
MSGAFDAGTATGRLVLDLQQWTASVEMAKKDTQSLAGVITSKKDEIEKLGKAFTAVGVAITGALGLAVKSAVDYTLEIGRMSVKTGIATETLSGLKEAADKSGMSLDELGVGMRRFSSLVFDASAGNKAASDTLARLGVSATDTTGKLKPMDQLLMETADKFKAMPNGVEKSALAIDLFGRSGTSMIAMMNRGSEGIRDFIAEQKEMGTQITAEGVAKAKAFSYSLMDLEHSFMGVKLAIANAIMPVVGALADIFTFVITKIRQLTDIFPPLGNSIVIITGAFGALAAIAGPLMFMLPQMAKGWTMIVGVIPLLQAKLLAMNTTLLATSGYIGIMVLALSTIKYMADLSNTAVDKMAKGIKENAGKIKDTWIWIGKEIDNQTKNHSIEMREWINAMRSMGKSNSEIAMLVYENYGKIIDRTKQVSRETAEMTQAVFDVMKTLVDKMHEVTLSDYQYRIYSANKYYDDLIAKAKGSENEQIVIDSANRVRAAEITKIKRDQWAAQTKDEKTYFQTTEQWLKIIDEKWRVVNDSIDKANQAVTGAVTEDWRKVRDSIGTFYKDMVKNADTGLNKMKTGWKMNWENARQIIVQVLQVLQQGFGQFFSGLQSQSDNYFKREFKHLDDLYKKQKDTLTKGYNAQIAALDAVDAAEALAARKKEIMMSNMTKEEKEAALLALKTEQDKLAARAKIEADYAAAQAILDAKQAEAKLALEIKQAKANKESGIAQAIVNTAVAVTTALCSKPFIPMGPIAATIALAAGYIQIRAIKSTPLPTLAEGGIANRATAAVFGEAGPEAILPLKELSRMLGLKRGGMGGSKTVNFGPISVIDSRGLDALFAESIIPRLRRAFGNESITVPVKAVR